jgi:hypothetical protein
MYIFFSRYISCTFLNVHFHSLISKDDFHYFIDFCALFWTTFYSFLGVNVALDTAALKAEVPHIIVATPGRLMDLATRRKVQIQIFIYTLYIHTLLCIYAWIRLYVIHGKRMYVLYK